MTGRLLFNLVLATACVTALPSVGQPQWRTDGETVEDTSSRKTVGDFGAILQVTDDADALFEAWNMAAAPGRGPNFVTVRSARRGDTVLAFVVFTGCAVDGNGNCDSDVEYTAFYPSGDVYGRHAGALWKGRPAPENGYLQLSEGNLGLRIELDDPLGTYVITSKIIDNISETVVTLSTEIVVSSD